MTISLYRKYRPQTFDQVVGQEHIERTLRNAVADGTTTHAYLFCGPRGTGKTTTARLLAKALLCDKGPTPDPCGTCEQCEEVAAGTHPDVAEMDAASRTGVDNVREEIIGRVAFAPTKGRFKIYIIDEVHMLSTAAFNALLKTLEEPPDHVVFIMCTTDPHKVPETIQSRCQRFDFHRIGIQDIMGNLRMICDSEGFKVEDAALEMIARQSSGGMRDAISTLEQLAVFTRGDITADAARGLLGEVRESSLQELVGLMAKRDVAGCFDWVAHFSEGGTDVAQLTRELTAYVRDLYVISLTNQVRNVPISDEDEENRKRMDAASFGGSDRLARVLTVLGDLGRELKTATDPRLSLEIALTRVAHPEADVTLDSLAERVEALEAGTVAVPCTPGAPSCPTPAVRTRSQTVASSQQSTPLPTRPAPAPSTPAPVAPRPAAVPRSEQHASATKASASVGEPQARSKPAPATPPANMDASTVSRLWRAASKAIIAQKASLVGALGGAHAFPDGDGVIIELPHDRSFTRRMLEEADNQLIIRDSLRQTFGKPVPFKVTVSSTEPVVPTMPAEDSPSIDLFEAAKPGEVVYRAPDGETPEGEGLSPAEGVDEEEPEFIYDEAAEGYDDDPSVPAFLDADEAPEPAASNDADGAVASGDDVEENLANLIFNSFQKEDEGENGEGGQQ